MQHYPNIKLNDNFNNWFEDSKGVDGNNKPQVYYHKSRSKETFDFFRDYDIVKNNFNNCYGYYFTADYHKHHVEYLGDGLDYFVFLKMLKPLTINDNGKGNIVDSEGNKYTHVDITESYVNGLKDKGYDSIIINCPLYYNQYVVFCSHQIKSIDNNGDYSTEILNMFK